MIFEFVVHRLHWLSKIPLLPQIFDAALLACTALTRPAQVTAMDRLEQNLLSIAGVTIQPHRFGGVGFVFAGEELAHLHGNGLLDLRVTREIAGDLTESGAALPHHLFGKSAWVSFWIRTDENVAQGCELFVCALTVKKNLPYPLLSMRPCRP
jgi:hypothetical protein